MEIVSIALVDFRRRSDATDKEVEEERGENTPLRHPHLNLLPFAGFALVDAADTSVPQIGDEPTLHIAIQICATNHLEEPVVVDHIEGLAKVDAEKAGPDGRFRLVQASSHICGQRKQGGDGRVAFFETER